jgi:hypothetical protein
MSDTWRTVKVLDIKAGDTVRTQSGQVVTVSRIETPFLGMSNMVAFIEDTPERWFKQPMMADADVEIRAATA